MFPAPDPRLPWHFEITPWRSYTGHRGIRRDQLLTAYSRCASINLSSFRAALLSNGSPPRDQVTQRLLQRCRRLPGAACSCFEFEPALIEAIEHLNTRYGILHSC